MIECSSMMKIFISVEKINPPREREREKHFSNFSSMRRPKIYSIKFVILCNFLLSR